MENIRIHIDSFLHDTLVQGTKVLRGVFFRFLRSVGPFLWQRIRIEKIVSLELPYRYFQSEQMAAATTGPRHLFYAASPARASFKLETKEQGGGSELCMLISSFILVPFLIASRRDRAEKKLLRLADGAINDCIMRARSRNKKIKILYQKFSSDDLLYRLSVIALKFSREEMAMLLPPPFRLPVQPDVYAYLLIGPEPLLRTFHRLPTSEIKRVVARLYLPALLTFPGETIRGWIAIDERKSSLFSFSSRHSLNFELDERSVVIEYSTQENFIRNRIRLLPGKTFSSADALPEVLQTNRYLFGFDPETRDVRVIRQRLSFAVNRLYVSTIESSGEFNIGDMFPDLNAVLSKSDRKSQAWFLSSCGFRNEQERLIRFRECEYRDHPVFMG